MVAINILIEDIHYILHYTSLMYMYSWVSDNSGTWAQPESSTAVYIIERELAYFVYLCHHSLHWL